MAEAEAVADEESKLMMNDKERIFDKGFDENSDSDLVKIPDHDFDKFFELLTEIEDKILNSGAGDQAATAAMNQNGGLNSKPFTSDHPIQAVDYSPQRYAQLLANISQTLNFNLASMTSALSSQVTLANCAEDYTGAIKLLLKIQKDYILNDADNNIRYITWYANILDRICISWKEDLEENTTLDSQEVYIEVLAQFLEIISMNLEHFNFNAGGMDGSIPIKPLALAGTETESNLCVLILRLLEFAVRSRHLKIPPLILQSILSTLRELWIFLKTRLNHLCPWILRCLVNPAESKFVLHLVDVREFGPCLQILFEMFEGSEFEDRLITSILNWFAGITESENIIPFLTILVPFLKSEEMLGLVRHSDKLILSLRLALLSNSLIECKQSVFILRTLTSTELIKIDNTKKNKNEDHLFLFKENNGNNAKFWSDFFDVYEILDEKQIHIIKPVLPKLQAIKNIILSSVTFNPELLTRQLQWFFVLLRKMTHHDNRFVVREGIILYMDAAETFIPIADSESESVKETFKNFLPSSLFPTLRESVGWILPNAPDFFEIATRFGASLNVIFEEDFALISNCIMSFLNGFDIGVSPPAVFFLILTLSKGIQNPLLNNSADAIQILESYTQFLKKGMNVLDKFLRLGTQKLFACIFYELYPFINSCIGNLKNPLAIKVFGFLGALDNFVICWLKESRKIESDFNTAESGSHGMNAILKNIGESVDLSIDEISGIYRFFFITRRAMDPPFYPELDLSSDFKIGILNAHLDYLQCIVSSQEKYSDIIIEEMHRIFKRLNIKNSESGLHRRPSYEHQPMEFDFCIKVLEMIAEPAACFDSDSSLLAELTTTYKTLSAEQDLGKISTVDFEMFALWKTYAKFLLVHPTTKEVEYTGVFLLENFETIIKATDPATYNQSVSIPNGKFKLEFTERRMSILSLILRLNQKKFQSGASEYKEKNVKVIKSSILKSILDEMDLADQQGVIVAMDFLAAALTFVSDECHGTRKILEGYVDTCWKNVFEMRRSESFWPGVRGFVEIITHPYFSGKGILGKYAKLIFEKSDSVTGISLYLLEKIYESISTFESITKRDEIIAICEEAIWFGPPLLKHIKVTHGLWEYVQLQSSLNSSDSKLNEDSYNFVFNANAKTRLIGIKSILKIVKTYPEPNDVLLMIIGHLLDKNDLESKKQKRYFGNSAPHRVKQRIAQALLLLQPYFNKEISEYVIARMMGSLTGDSPQPSVRYLMEWTIIRCLINYPELLDVFFQNAEKCCKERVGFGAFVSTICLHTSTNLNNAIFSEKSLRVLSTLLMGQHFTVRLYARTCFRKIYEHIISQSIPSPPFLTKFEILYEVICEENVQTAGNSSRISQNIDADFYVEVFNPVKHYFYEVAFIHLPKIAGMASDELIQENDLQAVFELTNSVTTEDSFMKFDHDKAMKQIYTENAAYAWHLRAVADDGREMGEETATKVSEVLDITNNFQKKWNPWKFLALAPEISDFPEKLQSRKAACRDGLIVVASLVDRIPNLGGLCRTCEIFGVSKYVISRLKSLDDKQFQSLSVSAQKWIDILEVQPRDLEVFLSTYVKKGYTILGIEQALESVPLNKYEFPKKSILLLGNEKFGIPPNLLHLVNQCLEIPQVGVVRSLNVHVTGALCIWQYAMQHTV